MLSYTTVNFPQLSLPAPLLVVLGGVLPDLEDVGDPPWRYPSLVVLVVLLGVFFPWWSFGDVVVVLEGIVK
jgi:hypothetical protein